MQIVVAEKPSVAQSIAQVIRANKKENGYLEGNGYIVTWCYGHLLELAYPEAYDEKFKKWNIEDLPIVPYHWIYGIKKSSAAQYKILKELFQRSDVESIVCATDAGREGELIFRNLYEKLNCKKPIYRLWLSSMEDSAVQAGFKNLRPGKEYDNLYAAALCRERADWLAGINLSRLFTLIYGGERDISVGRVMSATLEMIAERGAEIESFVKKAYYNVHIISGEIDAVSDKIEQKEIADQIATKCDGKKAYIKSVKQEIKKTQPPLLYDLTSLQRDCNRLFGFAADKTLDIVQELYEKKLTTYPRTDSQYLTEDMEEKIEQEFKNSFVRLFSDESLPNIHNTVRLLDNKKVTDHTAIITTGRTEQIESLNKDSLMVYNLITLRIITALSRSYQYNSLSAEVVCEDITFSIRGQSVVDPGFKQYEEAFRKIYNISQEKVSEKEKSLPDLQEGNVFTVSSKVVEKFTKPPAQYTDDTLLDAMEHAGNKELNAEVERKGLGTSATRAGVIVKLLEKNYIVREKKNLVITDLGKYVVSVLPDQIKSVSLTCDWENQLLEVSRGNLSADRFMKDTRDFIDDIIAKNKKVTPVEHNMELSKICICPACSGNIVEGKYGPYCSNKCGIVLKLCGKQLSAKEVQILIGERKKILLTGLISKKNREKYKAYFQYEGVQPSIYTDKNGNEKNGFIIKCNISYPKSKE